MRGHWEEQSNACLEVFERSLPAVLRSEANVIRRINLEKKYSLQMKQKKTMYCYEGKNRKLLKLEFQRKNNSLVTKKIIHRKTKQTKS